MAEGFGGICAPRNQIQPPVSALNTTNDPKVTTTSQYDPIKRAYRVWLKAHIKTVERSAVPLDTRLNAFGVKACHNITERMRLPFFTRPGVTASEARRGQNTQGFYTRCSTEKVGCHNRMRLTAPVPPPHRPHSVFPTSTPSPGLSFADHNDLPRAPSNSRKQSSQRKIVHPNDRTTKYNIDGKRLALWGGGAPTPTRANITLGSYVLFNNKAETQWIEQINEM